MTKRKRRPSINIKTTVKDTFTISLEARKIIDSMYEARPMFNKSAFVSDAIIEKAMRDKDNRHRILSEKWDRLNNELQAIGDELYAIDKEEIKLKSNKKVNLVVKG